MSYHVFVRPSTDNHRQSLYWPVTTAHLSDLYPFFEELKSPSSNYTLTSNKTSPSMFSAVSAAVEQNIAPFFETINHYGTSYQLSSRLVPQSYIDPCNTTSITIVAEAIWSGLQILNKPLSGNTEGLFGPAEVLIIGYMHYATTALETTTGANPALYTAAWQSSFSA